MKSLYTIAALLFTIPVLAQPGALDTTYGSDGITTSSFTNAADLPGASAIQSDDKILSVGYSNINNNVDVSIVRYDQNGSPDPTFGDQGWVVFDIGNGINEPRGIAVMEDGRIVVAGVQGEGLQNFFAARLHPDGTFDETFGNGGTVVVDANASGEEMWAMALQSDGKILLCGVPTGYSQYALVMRLNFDGNIDTDFGVNGIAQFDLEGLYTEATAIIALPDGTILVGGNTGTLDEKDAFVLKLNNDGTLFESFGEIGIAIFGSEFSIEHIRSIAFDDDGNIFGCGYVFYTNSVDSDYYVFKLNPNGSQNSGFADMGSFIYSSGSVDEYLKTIRIDMDGKLVIAGNGDALVDNQNGPQFVCMRLSNSGNLDPSFGEDGMVEVSVPDILNVCTGMHIQSDDKIVITGRAIYTNYWIHTSLRLIGCETVAVELNHPEESLFTLAPNPCNNQLSLFSDQTLAPKEIIIRDMEGRLVMQSKTPLSLQKGAIQIVLPETMATGTYVLTCLTETGLFNQRFVHE